MSTPELPLRRITLIGGALGLTVVAVVMVVGLLLRLWQLPWQVDRNTLPTGWQAPQPGVQDDQAGERRAEWHRQQQRLQTLGWVEAERGWVHVPIETAIELSSRPAQEGP